MALPLAKAPATAVKVTSQCIRCGVQCWVLQGGMAWGLHVVCLRMPVSCTRVPALLHLTQSHATKHHTGLPARQPALCRLPDQKQ